mmetsp:Transcript_8103/g.19595  ORF Transcript_8103/g.19595 Transcript_8103/m.19595 type:complete len:234 (+) Transcript_8103:518-1219(+)
MKRSCSSSTTVSTPGGRAPAVRGTTSATRRLRPPLGRLFVELRHQPRPRLLGPLHSGFGVHVVPLFALHFFPQSVVLRHQKLVLGQNPPPVLRRRLQPCFRLLQCCEELVFFLQRLLQAAVRVLRRPLRVEVQALQERLRVGGVLLERLFLHLEPFYPLPSCLVRGPFALQLAERLRVPHQLPGGLLQRGVQQVHLLRALPNLLRKTVALAHSDREFLLELFHDFRVHAREVA